jgi:3-methyl-2-oxobutanoate hydroxymethyltransferase
MSDTAPPPARRTAADLRARKRATPIVCLTAYTTPVARLLDPHVDLLLVGDSLGMVVYGMENTRGVTLSMIIEHGKAVMRGSSRAFVLLDMPFGSFETSPAQALESAKRLIGETGAGGVKIEGDAALAPTVEALSQAGIPVMAHIGLLPQTVVTSDGYRIQGRQEGDEARLVADARALESAGAFSLLIEATIEPIARAITESVSIPTIGIGASPACDGQVLVIDDVIGLFGDFTPRFVKRYAEIGPLIGEAAAAYAAEVRARTFPTQAHTFGLKPKKRIVEPKAPYRS